MRPLIGITVAHVEEELSTYPRDYYVQAVNNAGGAPLLLPPLAGAEVIERYLRLVDGVILSGGSDLDASLFGEEPLLGTGRVYPERDCFELALAGRALELDLPLLGICRGVQVLNIAAGGDIYQDIRSQVAGVLEHSQKAPRDYPWHGVELAAASILGSICGCEGMRVNSFHHQAVRTVAPGFKVAARAKDGVIEAIEGVEAKFALGVQWHPEAMGKDGAGEEIFAAFIAATAIGLQHKNS